MRGILAAVVTVALCVLQCAGPCSSDVSVAPAVPARALGGNGGVTRVDTSGSYCPSPFGQGDLVLSHHTGPRGADPWRSTRAASATPAPATEHVQRRLRSKYHKPKPSCYKDNDWSWEWCPGSLPEQSHELYKKAMLPPGADVRWDPASEVGVYGAYRLEQYRGQLSPFDGTPVMGLTPALVADIMRVATLSDVLPALTTPMKLHFELLVQANCGAGEQGSGSAAEGAAGSAAGGLVDAGAGASVEGMRGTPQPLGSVQQLHVYFKVGDEGHEERVLAESVSCVAAASVPARPRAHTHFAAPHPFCSVALFPPLTANVVHWHCAVWHWNVLEPRHAVDRVLGFFLVPPTTMRRLDLEALAAEFEARAKRGGAASERAAEVAKGVKDGMRLPYTPTRHALRFVRHRWDHRGAGHVRCQPRMRDAWACRNRQRYAAVVQ